MFRHPRHDAVPLPAMPSRQNVTVLRPPLSPPAASGTIASLCPLAAEGNVYMRTKMMTRVWMKGKSLVFAFGLMVGFVYLQSDQMTKLIYKYGRFFNVPKFNIVNNDNPYKGYQEQLLINDGRCLGFGIKEEFDALISSSKQIFITMPAKAAGTTWMKFTKECVGSPVLNESACINKWNCESEWLKSTTLHSNYVNQVKAPQIVASHLTSDKTLIRIIRNSNTHTLIIYQHREETDRLVSAIKHVVQRSHREILFDGTKNLLAEEKLIKLIKSKKDEIGQGQDKILTCDTYDAMKETSPNMIFMNYKHSDRLQKILSKHYCPERLAMDAVRENDFKKKKLTFLVKLPSINNSSGAVVDFHEWLEGKRYMIEWALDMRADATCRSKTKHLENKIFGCSDKAFEVAKNEEN